MQGIHLVDSVNLNNLVDVGHYYAYGGNTIAGKPTGVSAFGLEVYRVAGSYVAQCLTDSGGDNRMFLRIYDTHTWSEWTEFVKKGDLNEIRSTYYTDQANHVIVTFTKRQGILYAKTAGPNGGGTGVLYLFGIHYDLKNITLIKIGGADYNVIASNTGLDYQFDMALLASDESTRFAYVTFMINQF